MLWDSGAVDNTNVGSHRALSQQEIDNVFRKLRDSAGEDNPAPKAQPYDFRRPDRIAKDQLRAIHILHENFARSLAASLSAYLRAYVVVSLVNVEQLSFLEFAQCLPAPTSLVTLGMRPYDGSAVLEINPSLVFPILEMLLGGTGRQGTKISREITEIEQSVLDTLLRIILHDMRAAWNAVTEVDFIIETHETEPQLLQNLAPSEAVVAISMEVRIGDTSGMMNISIPSITVKMLRQKFDQQWSLRRKKATEEEHERVLKLIRPAHLHADARLQGATLGLNDLLDLKAGDLLSLSYPVNRPVDLMINGRLKYRGEIHASEGKRAFSVLQLLTET